MSVRSVPVAGVTVGGKSLTIIAGPCVIESQRQCLEAARRLKETVRRAGFPFIFKASFDKANRLSLGSYRGPGMLAGLDILAAVKSRVGVPVLSDVHCVREVARAKAVLDVIQIPALLCRQTDLVLAAAETGLPVNIKKGQFLAPWDMGPIVRKAESSGNRRIILTERGYSFGYNNLVTDLRSLQILRSLGYPVIFDATHSVQLPGGKGGSSGGQRQFVAPLARAAVAFGCDGIFMEVHPRPDAAPCDGPNMIGERALPGLLRQLRRIGTWGEG